MTKNFTPGLWLQDKSKQPDLTTALAPGFCGILLQMPWASVEPQQGKYNFDNVRSLLEWGKVNGRQVALMLFDRDFNTPAGQSKIVPRWVASEPFNKKLSNGGCVAKLWTPAVNDARIALLKALVAEFGDSPYLEAIALQETALGGINSTDQPDYSHEKYCTEIVRLIYAVAPDMKRVQLWQAINWLGPFNAPYLDRIAQAIFHTRAGGLTNPDSVKWEKDQKPMYAVMKRWADKLPIAFGGDTSQLEKPGDQYATFADLVRMQYDFATDHGAHYILYNANGFHSKALSGATASKEYGAAIKAFVRGATMTVQRPTTLIGDDVPPTPDPEVDPVPDATTDARVAALEAALATMRNDMAAMVAQQATLRDGFVGLEAWRGTLTGKLRELAN